MSIAQIAKITGVSDATVSRVLNNRPGPSSETAQAVSLAAREIGYLQKKNRQRNKAATTGRDLKSDVFAFLALGMTASRNAAGNNVLLTVIHSIENALMKHHCNLNINFVKEEKEIPKMLLNGYVDGFFIFGRLDLSERVMAKLRKTPSIWVMYNCGGWGSHFTPDNIAIGEEAARYALDKGFKDIAMLMASKESPVTPFAERAKGFKELLESAGRKVDIYCSERDTAILDIDPVSYSRMISEEIGKLLDRMLEQKTLPEVIFVPSDNEVSVLYHHLAGRNIEVGKDVFIITCDGHNLPLLHPQPTIIDIRSDLVGKYAAEHMLLKLSDNDTGDVKMLVKPELKLD
jgi:LacI family transcriptional regulator